MNKEQARTKHKQEGERYISRQNLHISCPYVKNSCCDRTTVHLSLSSFTGGHGQQRIGQTTTLNSQYCHPLSCKSSVNNGRRIVLLRRRRCGRRQPERPKTIRQREAQKRRRSHPHGNLSWLHCRMRRRFLRHSHDIKLVHAHINSRWGL